MPVSSTPKTGSRALTQRTRQVVLGLLCAAGLVLGLGAVVSPASAEPSATSISGTVTTAGVPAAGTIVEVLRYNAWRDDWRAFNATEVDASGQYTVAVAAGTYKVRFGRVPGQSGLYRHRFFSADDPAGTKSVWDSSDVVVEAATPTTDIDAELVSRTGITGHITKTVSGRHQVAVMAVNLDTGRRYFKRIDVRSGKDYQFLDLRPGNYRVEFNRISGASLAAEYFDNVRESAGPNAATTVVVSADKLTTGIDAELTAGKSITGTLVDQSGTPYTGCSEIRAYGPGGALVLRTGQIDDSATGHFTVRGLNPGDYNLRFDNCVTDGGFRADVAWYDGTTDLTVDRAAAAAVSVPSGGQDFADALVLDSTLIGPRTRGTIEGTVTVPQGVDPGDVEVRAVPTDENVRWRSEEATVQADGTYAISARPGSYRVSFARVSGESAVAAQFYNGHDEPDGWASGDVVTVQAGKRLTGIDATLVPGGKIIGRLLNGAGDPQARCWIVATTPGSRLVERLGRSAADGTFAITGLSTGQYRVAVRRSRDCSGKTYLRRSDAPVDQSGPSLPVSSTMGQTTTLGDLTIGRLGSISGTLILPAGTKGFVNRLVELTRVVDGRTRRAGSTYADRSDGSYTLDGVKPGSYVVSFGRVSGATVAAEYHDDVLEGAGMQAATQVGVGLSEAVTGVDATLGEGGSIEGRIFNSDGTPRRDCGLTAFTLEASFHGDAARSRPGGAFRLRGLSSGEYLVRVDSGECRMRSRGPLYLGANGALVTSVDDATPVPVVAGEATAISDITLAETGTLRGAIEAPAGTDPWYRVSVVDATTGQAVADQKYQGSRPFSFTGLAVGSYRIDVERSTGQTNYGAGYFGNVPESQGAGAAATYDVAADTTTDAGTYTLQRGGVLAASVVAPGGVNMWSCTTVAFTQNRSLSTRLGNKYSPGARNIRVAGLSTGSYLVSVGCHARNGKYYFGYYAGPGAPLSLDIDDAVPFAATLGETVVWATPLRFVEPEGTRLQNTEAPVISGTPKVGETLTVNGGLWTPTATTLSYQWFADGAPILAATSSAFTVTPDQTGAAITVKVTAAADHYRNGSVRTAATDPVTRAAPAISNAALPQITGTAKVGERLTASNGIWSAEDLTFTYRWLVGDTVVGATESTFEVPAAAVGRTITVEVTASGTGRASVTKSSSPTAEVVKGELVNRVAPAITGTPRVGETLAGTDGTWSPAVTTTRRWLADDVVVDGETGTTLTLTRALRGKKISLEVTAKAEGYADGMKVSAKSDAVKPARPASDDLPQIVGKAKVGKTLTVMPGTWNDDDLTFAYQWWVDGEAIEDATAEQFVVPAAAVGKPVRVEVTASGAGRDPTTTMSEPTDPVAAGTIEVTAKPKAKGKVKVGKKVKVTAPRSSAAERVKVTYAWYANGKRIKGATKSSLKLTKNLAKKKLTAKVTLSSRGSVTRTFTVKVGKVKK